MLNKHAIYKRVLAVFAILSLVATTLMSSALEIEISDTKSTPASPDEDVEVDVEVSDGGEIAIVGISTEHLAASYNPEDENDDEITEYYNGANEFPTVYVGPIGGELVATDQIEWSYGDSGHMYYPQRPEIVNKIYTGPYTGDAHECPAVGYTLRQCPFTTNYITASITGWTDQTEEPTKDNVALTYTSSGVAVDADDYEFDYDADREGQEIMLTDADGGHCDGDGAIYIEAPLKIVFSEDNVSVDLDGWTDRTKEPTKDDIKVIIAAKGVAAGSSDFEFRYDAENERIVITAADGGCFQGDGEIYVDAPLEDAYISFDRDHITVSLENWTDRTKEPGLNDVELTLKETGAVIDSSEYELVYDLQSGKLSIYPAYGSTMFEYGNGQSITVDAPLEAGEDTPQVQEPVEEEAKETVIILSRKEKKDVSSLFQGISAMYRKYLSSSKGIAKVSKKGVVTGKKGGEATISLQTGDSKKGPWTDAGSIKVKVIDPRMSKGTASLSIGGTADARSWLSGNDEEPIGWESSNTGVAEVSKDGVVTAKAKGKAKIYPVFKSGRAKVYKKVKVK